MSDPVYELVGNHICKDGHTMFMEDVVKDMKALQYMSNRHRDYQHQFEHEIVEWQFKVKEFEKQVAKEQRITWDIISADGKILQAYNDKMDRQQYRILELEAALKHCLAIATNSDHNTKDAYLDCAAIKDVINGVLE